MNFWDIKKVVMINFEAKRSLYKNNILVLKNVDMEEIIGYVLKNAKDKDWYLESALSSWKGCTIEKLKKMLKKN